MGGTIYPEGQQCASAANLVLWIYASTSVSLSVFMRLSQRATRASAWLIRKWGEAAAVKTPRPKNCHPSIRQPVSQTMKSLDQPKFLYLRSQQDNRGAFSTANVTQKNLLPGSDDLTVRLSLGPHWLMAPGGSLTPQLAQCCLITGKRKKEQA